MERPHANGDFAVMARSNRTENSAEYSEGGGEDSDEDFVGPTGSPDDEGLGEEAESETANQPVEREVNDLADADCWRGVEEGADLPGVEPTEDDLRLKGVYGDYPHENDVTHLSGG